LPPNLRKNPALKTLSMEDILARPHS
jgi:hypothetical protein